MLAQQLRDGQGEVGGGDAGAKRAGQAHTGDDGCEQGNRLAEHGGFGFNATDAPAQNAHSVNHGGMGCLLYTSRCV